MNYNNCNYKNVLTFHFKFIFIYNCFYFYFFVNLCLYKLILFVYINSL